jgi:hypothetical protein
MSKPCWLAVFLTAFPSAPQFHVAAKEAGCEIVRGTPGENFNALVRYGREHNPVL